MPRRLPFHEGRQQGTLVGDRRSTRRGLAKPKPAPPKRAPARWAIAREAPAYDNAGLRTSDTGCSSGGLACSVVPPPPTRRCRTPLTCCWSSHRHSGYRLRSLLFASHFAANAAFTLSRPSPARDDVTPLRSPQKSVSPLNFFRQSRSLLCSLQK